MSETNEYEQLLEKVQVIVDHEKEVQDGMLSRGEKFNVFNILGLWSDEVRLHSAFLAELLNPNGTHGLKDKFLKKFCEIVGFDNFPTKNAIVTTEAHIGYINEDCTEGGNIDILIESEDKKWAIVIENKIYAVDQDKQLLRYDNFLKKFAYSKLIYLTLDGHEASDFSKCNIKDDECISYKSEIRDWLDYCIEQSAKLPLVRETLCQYKTLIDQLTNQEITMDNGEEIIKILLKGDNLKTADTVAGQIENAKLQIVNTKLIPLIKAQAKEVGVDFTYDENSDLYQRNETRFRFTKGGWKYYAIGIGNENSGCSNWFSGIYRLDDFVDSTELMKKEIAYFPDSNQWWPKSRFFNNKYRDWDIDTFVEINEHPEKMCKVLMDEVDTILKIIETEKIAM